MSSRPWIIYEGPTSHQHRVAHLPRLMSQYSVPTADFCLRFACGATGNRARLGYYIELPAAVVGLPVLLCGPCQARYGHPRVKPAAEQECDQLRAQVERLRDDISGWRDECDQAFTLLRAIRRLSEPQPNDSMNAHFSPVAKMIDASGLLDDEGQQP